MARKRNNPDELVQRPSLSCAAADVDLLRHLGKGNASRGLREALEIVRFHMKIGVTVTSTDESPAT
jgi:hypothetical protein